MRRLLTVTSIVLSGVLFVGCNKDNDDPIETPVAGLMAANLATDKQSIGIALSGNAISNSPLTFTSFTGGYLPIYAGARNVEAYDFYTGVAFTSDNQSFEIDKYYSLFVVGANDNYRNLVVEDDFESLSSSSGMAYIRYVNAIPDSAQTTVTIEANGSNAVNENAAFASVSNFVEVSPGSVTIDASNGGSVDASRTITVEAGKVYTVLLVGDPMSATATVEIRYIENGTLEQDEAGRTSAGAQSTNLQ